MLDPHGVTAAPDGRMYVADFAAAGAGTGTIYRIEPNAPGQAAVSTGAPFVDPRGIALEPPRCRGKLATIVGTTAAEKIRGTDFADVIVTLGGKDTAIAGKGKDIVCGGAGPDKLNGGPGKDLLFGEGGKDKFAGGKGKDKCVGAGGRDTGKGCEKGKL
jgi:Ca2+-binding RTX toxin-like protein